MAKVKLLTTEENVKMIGVLDENLAGNYLRAAIMEAQEVGLRRILGSALLDALKAEAEAASLAGAHADLVNNFVQFYLAYAAKAELLPKVAYKTGNAGVIKTRTDGIEPANAQEIATEVARAQAKADYYCYRMQGYLLEHLAEFPELTAGDCNAIRACLYSAASCGIWLGGPRGDYYEGDGHYNGF